MLDLFYISHQNYCWRAEKNGFSTHSIFSPRSKCKYLDEGDN